MSRPITEYRCLLISPGDVSEEREGLAKAVDRWNALVGEVLDARVRLVRWEADGVPDASAPPQQVLNRQIVDESDFGVALFWARLGTPTGTHAAGSLEEIEQLQRRGARVLIYFKNAPVPQELLRDDQYARVSEFKARMEKEGLLGSFSGTNYLVQQVVLHLTAVVADLLKRDRAQPQPDENKQAVLTAPRPDVRVVIFPMGTIPPTPGINHLLGIRVQNYSPVVVFVSGISILLKSNKGLLLYRDAVTGMEQRRYMLHPGESYSWSANGDALLAEHAVEDIDDVVVFDDIGRDYRPAKGTLQHVLNQWQAEGEAKK